MEVDRYTYLTLGVIKLLMENDNIQGRGLKDFTNEIISIIVYAYKIAHYIICFMKFVLFI